MASKSAIIGCLLGTAVGDALGLPYEGLSKRRARKLLPTPDRHRLLPNRGMVSDDTEHACLVAQSLIATGIKLDPFAKELARRMRFWLLGMPGGVGFATLRATSRLWLGIPPDRSGVFSAGNGPAMRAPVLGASVDDWDLLRSLVRVSTRMTHTDPRAELGALAVALSARLASTGSEVHPREYAAALNSLIGSRPDPDFIELIEQVTESAERQESTESFAASVGLGNGVSGYMYHTVPIALHAWLVHQRDLRAAVVAVIRCGGDTDTTGAIVGGIVGCAVGQPGIPADWLAGLWEWPRTVDWLVSLGSQLYEVSETRRAARPIRLSVSGLCLRNATFLGIVLMHGVRRLLPPY